MLNCFRYLVKVAKLIQTLIIMRSYSKRTYYKMRPRYTTMETKKPKEAQCVRPTTY